MSSQHNIKEVLIIGYNELKKQQTQSAVLDTELLLAAALKKEKEYLLAHPEIKVRTVELNKYQKLIKRRIKGEPVAYLVGKKEFYGLDFFVDKRVLIPRPETEQLVEEIINFSSNKKITIADIGTGSGAIAVSLAKNLPLAKILATDISSKAILVAKNNAKINKVKIKFFMGSLLEPLKNQRIDVIVSNPPYLNQKEMIEAKKFRNSLKFEPALALFGGKTGLEVTQKLLSRIKKMKYQPKLVYLETTALNTNLLKNILKKSLPEKTWQIKKDYSGRNRFVVINWASA